MILKSIKFGIAQMWANKRLVLIYYLANLFFGLILVLPLRSVLSKFVGFSLMGAELGGRMNMDFLFYLVDIAATIIGSSKDITMHTFGLQLVFLMQWQQ